ncbi:MAG: hypothetical protein V5A62_13980 [Haloarculaceae archaeon]
MVPFQPVGTVVLRQAGTPAPTPTPTPFDSTAVSSPEFAAVAATLFAVLGALVLLDRFRGR